MLAFILAGIALLLLAGALWQHIMADRDAAAGPGRLVDIGDRRLHLLCQGEGGGPTVVIEQGAGSPSVFWWAVQDRVAGFARVMTYDRAGMLWSDPAPRGRSLEDRVSDLEALLAAAGIPGPYVLVGHSYGGMLVRLFAERRPDDVAGVVLVDVADEGVVFGLEYQRFLGWMRFLAPVMGWASRLGLFRLLARFGADEKPPGGLTAEAAAIGSAAMTSPATMRAATDDMLSLRGRSVGFGGSLGDRPVVVISHGQPYPGPMAFMEPLWPACQARLMALSTGSRLIEATESNHMIYLDQPDLVVEAIRDVWHISRGGARP